MSDFEFTPPDLPESTMRALEAAWERGRPLPVERLLAAANRALLEMCNTTAPRNSFTDAVDELDAAIDAMRLPAATGGQFGDQTPYPKGVVMGQREAASAQQDEREAFEAYNPLGYAQMDGWAVWQAACAWQRSQQVQPDAPDTIDGRDYD